MQRFRNHRYPTAFPAQVKTAFGIRPAKVIDVNEQGAQLENTADLAPGDKVVLKAGADQVNAVVRWAENDRVGIMFRPMLTIRQVDSLRYAKRPSMQTRFSSVGLAEMR